MSLRCGVLKCHNDFLNGRAKRKRFLGRRTSDSMILDKRRTSICGVLHSLVSFCFMPYVKPTPHGPGPWFQGGRIELDDLFTGSFPYQAEESQIDVCHFHAHSQGFARRTYRLS
jgi:hypothetical protein